MNNTPSHYFELHPFFYTALSLKLGGSVLIPLVKCEVSSEANNIHDDLAIDIMQSLMAVSTKLLVVAGDNPHSHSASKKIPGSNLQRRLVIS